MSHKVMFRDDDRHPRDNGMFTAGFKKRDPKLAKPVYRRDAVFPIAGDLDPASGVCISQRFEASAMFALKVSPESARVNSFIYAVPVDVTKLLNTHELQVRDALGIKVIRKVGGRTTTQWHNFGASYNAEWAPGTAPMWPLFAHAMAMRQHPLRPSHQRHPMHADLDRR